MRSDTDTRMTQEPTPPGTFVSGGGDAAPPPSRPVWWLPALTTMVFGLVLAGLLLTSGSRSDLVPQATDAPRTTAGPRTSPCIACSLGHECDGETGQCVLIDRSDVECVAGATYDEEAGYCVAEATPAPVVRTEPRVRGRSGPTPVPQSTPPPPVATPASTPGAAPTAAPASPAPTPAQ